MKSVSNTDVPNAVPSDVPSAIPAATPSPRILKIGTCPSVSGKSQLTYHVGCNADGSIYLRVFSNTGGGFFNPEWRALSDIQQLLDKQPEGKPITSHTLYPLFAGRSMNSPAFLLAVLKAETLVTVAQDKPRCHSVCNPEGFLMATKALMASDVDLKVVEKTRKTTAKVPAQQQPAVSGKPADRSSVSAKKSTDKAHPQNQSLQQSKPHPQNKLGL